MPFFLPKSDHEIYKTNFLNSVICQIKVQPIYRIAGNTPPADFQEKIRKEYPIVKSEEAIQVEQKGRNFHPRSLGNIWRFTSEDNLWQVTLDSAFIALQTKAYSSFTDFKERFEKVHNSYIKTYAPSRPERVGLRYINMIRPINIKSLSEWVKWIRPELFGLIGNEEIFCEPIFHDFKELQTTQEPGSMVVKHGLMKDQEKQSFYLIDIDRFMMGAANHNEAISFLSKFNKDSFDFYSWAIGEECIKWMKGEA